MAPFSPGIVWHTSQSTRSSRRFWPPWPGGAAQALQALTARIMVGLPGAPSPPTSDPRGQAIPLTCGVNICCLLSADPTAIPEPEDLGDGLQEPWDGPVSFEPGMLLPQKVQEGQAGRKNPGAQVPSPLLGWCHFRKTLCPESAGSLLWLCISLPRHQGGKSHRILHYYLLAKPTHRFP